MATEINYGGDDLNLFVGEDKQFVLFVVDENGAPVDITGWNVRFVIRLSDFAEDPPIFDIVANVAGAFGVDQRLVAVLTDTQLDTVLQIVYRHSWKRMDFPETVLAVGNWSPKKSTAKAAP